MSPTPGVECMLEEIANARKQAGPITRAASITGLSCRHCGRRASRRHIGKGVSYQSAECHSADDRVGHSARAVQLIVGGASGVGEATGDLREGVSEGECGECE